ncbi:MAG: hypothetical protein WDZ93_02345 [Candidatus Paceibacterota bacterium]
MEQKSTTREDWLAKILAIIGFVVMVLLLTWIAVQLVRVLPGAFASLASLAEDVNDARVDIPLDVVASNNVVNSRSSVEIIWSEQNEDGTYTFTYSCVDGVTADIRTADGQIVPLACDTPYTAPKDTFKIDVLFASTNQRFADVSYRILFTPSDRDEDASEVNKTLTIVNASIPFAGANTGEEEDDAVVATDDDTSVTPAPIQYRTVKTVTYSTPVSDPNGYTELRVEYLAVGTLTSGNSFTPRTTLESDDRGAFQFEVKNIGTKTSGTWRFEAKLPNGEKYESQTQGALKPQERALITIAFDGVGSEGTRQFGATITGGNDQSTANNSFSWTIEVRD